MLKKQSKVNAKTACEAHGKGLAKEAADVWNNLQMALGRQDCIVAQRSPTSRILIDVQTPNIEIDWSPRVSRRAWLSALES